MAKFSFENNLKESRWQKKTKTTSDMKKTSETKTFSEIKKTSGIQTISTIRWPQK